MASWLWVAVHAAAVLWAAGLPASAAQSPPYFSASPQDTRAALGYPATLYCSIANLGRRQVFWDIDSAGLRVVLGPFTNDHASYPRYTIDSSQGGGAFNLRIDKVVLTDAGTYSCLVNDPSDTESTVMEARAELVVEEETSPPKSTYPECDRDPASGSGLLRGVYMKGDILTLTCKTEGGVPQPQLSWEAVTASNDVYGLEQAMSVNGTVTTATAVVSLSSVDDGSFYRCVQRHPTSVGPPRRCSTPSPVSESPMDVRFKPEVTLTPSTVSLHRLQPQKVTLSCTVLANPPIFSGPTIILPENATYDYPHDGDKSLVEVELTTDDVGKDFYCRAENKEGIGEVSLTLKDLGLPTWVILVIIAAAGGVAFILLALLSCALCMDHSYLADDDVEDKESQPSEARPAWMENDYAEQAGGDDDLIPITEFEGGQESLAVPEQKPFYENSDFETGEKRYQNIGYKADELEGPSDPDPVDPDQ